MSKMRPLSKILLSLRLLLHSPLEFRDRLEAVLQVEIERRFSKAANYKSIDWPKGLETLKGIFGFDVQCFLTEPSFIAIEEEVKQKISELEFRTSPFKLSHNADRVLARFCYMVSRIIQPQAVVETGVAYGVTTAYILKALEVNQKGWLYSIDLPPLAHRADDFVGVLVPEYLRSRWRLYRGTSKYYLPRILKEISTVDLFIHDSLHTYRNIRFELEQITPHLGNPSVVLVDDIEGNSAFEEWVRETQLRSNFILAEDGKRSLMGFAFIAK